MDRRWLSVLGIICLTVMAACSVPSTPAPLPAAPTEEIILTEPEVEVVEPPALETLPVETQSPDDTLAPLIQAPVIPTVETSVPPTVGVVIDPASQAGTPAAPTTAAPVDQPAPVATPVVAAPLVVQSLPAVLPGPVGGVEMHRMDQAGGLDLMRSAGVKWIRRNALLWSDLEPEQGQRNWQALAGLEQELQNASAGGFQTILIVRNAPAWAQKVPGIGCGPIRVDKLPALAATFRDLVARYSQPPYNVIYWEFGNEPDVETGAVNPDSLYGCWGDPNDEYYGAALYAEALKMLYPAAKASNPGAQVLVGGLLLNCDPINPPQAYDGSGNLQDCSSARFLEGVLKNGGGDYFDAVSFHAYDYYLKSLGQYGNGNWHSMWNTTGPVLIAKARYLRSLLNVYGYPTKPLFNTEVALICGAGGTEPFCQMPEFENTKAYYLAQANAAAMAEGLQTNIWFSITGWRASGLVDRNKAPLLSYQALNFHLKELGGAVFEAQINQFPGVSGYQFSRQGKKIWLLWSLDGQDHPINLGMAPSSIYDVFGGLLQADLNLNVTIAPVYVEF